MITNTVLLERFEREGGLDYFDDEEMIRFLLDMARCPGDRDILVHDLLNEFGSIKGILEAREEQLRRIKGLGKRSAAMIRMVLPFTRMWERNAMRDQEHIGSSTEAEHYCKSLLMGLRHEQFHMICLNSRCYILGRRKISDGTLTEVQSYPRVILETALNYNAHSILVCHNHPGGTNYPSTEDIASTVQLQKILNSVGILLLDHIIVAGPQTYSMIQHGDISYKKA